MEKFLPVKGYAAVLDMDNVDTDMIVPKQFLKTVVRAGLGKALLYDLRFDEHGEEKAAFVLNRAPWREAKILIAGENFGCGSSREHAPWALRGFGIRVVIALGFADIFYNNCFQNALLPIVLTDAQASTLRGKAEGGEQFAIDLQSQTIETAGETIHFDIDPARKEALLEGRDEITETLEQGEAIAAFEVLQKRMQPWLYVST